MRCNNKVCLTGKTVIVTGSNTGIGFETALECAKRGAKVIVACRDELKGSVAVQNIKTLTGNYDVILKLIDFSSLQSVRRFADDVLLTEERLDILINNAGALALGNHITDDGFQLEMQVNYFGPALLTLILIDLLKKSAPSRIVNVSSIAAKRAKMKSVDKLMAYDGHFDCYANTKLCVILFTQELSKRLKQFDVSVFTLHPGYIATEILTRHLGPFKSCLTYMSRRIFKSPEEGAQTTLYCALEPGIEHLTGGFFIECQYQEHFKTAQNPILAEQLWYETIKVLNFSD
ncbi:retinol dehydrogenase 11-like [Diorhabda sublineata]|uniref:retinol dehydrogenase 11-like n=1 Tax=Diorhabda sublineata TaxID=1163346 RepID=UPI0024E14F7B|nr:retinol dehydrogenase 11-like [Diorhabda sublineata]